MTSTAVHEMLADGLCRLELAETADEAVEICRMIYGGAVSIHAPDEVLRAIEARLPAPTPAQTECCSLYTIDGAALIARVVGAFGNNVIFVISNRIPGRSELSEYTPHFFTRGCPPDDAIATPDWDAARPAVRRAHKQEQAAQSSLERAEA